MRQLAVTTGERPTVPIVNDSEHEQLFVLERTAWSDQALGAAEVTALQVFRDLFANEALRPDEPISVGTLTVLFTDLRDSTRFYLEIGDAPAFGSVMDHLDVLRAAVTAEGGAVVKAMGDAIMAVFPRPLAAVQAGRHAQRDLAASRNGGRPFRLKVGHTRRPMHCCDPERAARLLRLDGQPGGAARRPLVGRRTDRLLGRYIRPGSGRPTGNGAERGADRGDPERIRG